MPADTRYAWNNYCGEVLKYASGFLFLLFWPCVHRGGYYKYGLDDKNVARICFLAAGVFFFFLCAEWITRSLLSAGIVPLIWHWFYNHTEERNAIMSRAGPTGANGFSALLKGTKL